MEIIHGFSKLKRHPPAVVALGVFDGVHLAHQKILKAAVKIAKLQGLKSTAVTFWPHPQKKESIYSLEHRLKLISALGIDTCLVIKFTPAFSQNSPECFIRNILVKGLNSRYILVGRNFRFGQNAKGDFRLLNKFSQRGNFKLKVFGTIRSGNALVSSSYIRSLIMRGRLKAAQRLLGRRVSIFGTVIKGAAWAKNWGFPTANINPHHEVLPPPGIYAVRVLRGAVRDLNGVCYIGSKPTFQATKAKIKYWRQKHVEVYIYDFNQDIYGEDLEVEFIKKIRNERKFSSYRPLVEQIKKDILAAKKLFSRH